MGHSFFIMQPARPSFYKYENEFGQEKKKTQVDAIRRSQTNNEVNYGR